MLSIDRVRAQFPSLQRRIGGRPIAYFDGPGGTQVPEPVADAVRTYLLDHNANEGWNYPTSRETDEILHAGRVAMADLLGGRPEEIAFGQNMTTLTLRVSRALGLWMQPRDEVVVTELDHHANVDPWKALERERGVAVRAVRMDPSTGTLDLDDLASKLTDRTRVLAIGAASNALGTINDVRTAIARARDVGALVYVDAVHYAPHALPDVAALGADFMVVSPYKFYGPHLGVLWGRKERLEALELPRVESAPASVPERLETGTLPFESIAGATAAVDFLASLGSDDGAAADRGSADRGDRPGRGSAAGQPQTGPRGPVVTSARRVATRATAGARPAPVARTSRRRTRLTAAYQAMHEHGEVLFRRLWEGIKTIDGVVVFGVEPGGPRTPTLGFAIGGVDAREAAGALAERGLFLSHGDFYATTVIRRLGYGGRGILRAGCAVYTTEDEVDRLVEGVADLSR